MQSNHLSPFLKTSTWCWMSKYYKLPATIFSIWDLQVQTIYMKQWEHFSLNNIWRAYIYTFIFFRQISGDSIDINILLKKMNNFSMASMYSAFAPPDISVKWSRMMLKSSWTLEDYTNKGSNKGLGRGWRSIVKVTISPTSEQIAGTSPKPNLVIDTGNCIPWSWGEEFW